MHSRALLPSAPFASIEADLGSQGAPFDVRLAELVGRLSFAFDVADGAPHGRSVRAVVLAVELARRAGVNEGDVGLAIRERDIGFEPTTFSLGS